MYTIENPFVIESEQAAAEILEYFNAFHDGFIKRIIIESQDLFSERLKGDFMSRSQTVTGEFNLKIDIAHYNYGAGETPANRGVCLLFDDFSDFLLELKPGLNEDWIINEILFNRISRPLDTDAAYNTKQFQFLWKKPVYDEKNGWTEKELSLFSFAKGIIWEED